MSSINQKCCSVESIVSVDERGQMILPKELREKANISAGEKLALVAMYKDNDVCCISIVKADKLSGMVGNLLGPVLNNESN